ncbi:MAG: PEP-CTERM sorting domain-containing protein [Phenylobacterium sp.]|nr:MAG: PEP-CTERM sorting domain-containing protein [Phenylobacterium sp.]
MNDSIDYSGHTGGGHGNAGPLDFTVSNAAGMTFAGIGYQTNASGQVTVLGTGQHFESNSGGWWFTADIYDAATGLTYNVGARDAIGPCEGPACALTPGVPEPAAWSLMILGFGAAGAMMRRRRALAVA